MNNHRKMGYHPVKVIFDEEQRSIFHPGTEKADSVLNREGAGCLYREMNKKKKKRMGFIIREIDQEAFCI